MVLLQNNQGKNHIVTADRENIMQKETFKRQRLAASKKATFGSLSKENSNILIIVNREIITQPGNPHSSAKRWPASETVVLRPDSPSLNSSSGSSYTSCIPAPYLVASGMCGDPCLHWVLSGDMQLSNSASHAA